MKTTRTKISTQAHLNITNSVVRIDKHFKQQPKNKKDTKLIFFQNEKLLANPYVHWSNSQYSNDTTK